MSQALTRIINLRIEIDKLEKSYRISLTAEKESETLRAIRIKIAFLKLELIDMERLFHNQFISDIKYIFSLN